LILTSTGTNEDLQVFQAPINIVRLDWTVSVESLFELDQIKFPSNDNMRICSELAFNQEINWANDIHLTSTFYPTLGDRVHNTACILNSVTIPSSSFV
jgi:hypothetical protein